MKITRLKKVERFLTFFRNSYGFREPYYILIDGTFCAAAKKNKVNIAEQLPKYLGGNVKLITTQCAIMETEIFGKKLYGALAIIKQYKHHKCGHEGKPVPANECLLGMLGAKNENRYIIATQDWDLQKSAAQIPGVPVLYLHLHTPTMQPPSETSERMARLSSRERFAVNPLQREALLLCRKKLGIEEPVREEKKKKKKIRGPNPLSCKKKKKKKSVSDESNRKSQTAEGEENNQKKRRRKRVKIPQHVREHFQNSASVM